MTGERSLPHRGRILGFHLEHPSHILAAVSLVKTRRMGAVSKRAALMPHSTSINQKQMGPQEIQVRRRPDAMVGRERERGCASWNPVRCVLVVDV